MKLSEYIKKLERCLNENGDRDVFEGDTNTTLGCVRPTSDPKLKELAILSGRERNARYIISGDKPEAHSGRWVVYVGR